MKGLIVKSLSDKFCVYGNSQKYLCTSKKNLKAKKLLVGDNVEFDEKEKHITNLFQRKNRLIRPPIANLDKLFICVSDIPEVDYLLLDKLLVFCEVNDIKPIICYTKQDLSSNNKEYLQKVYEPIYKVIFVSSTQNIGIEDVKAELKNSISAFAGQSGVGKSALINAIFQKNKSNEGLLSTRIQRGKNTTRNAELFEIDKNSFIADTAGFSSLDEMFLKIPYEDLSRFYPDFLKYMQDCKFNSCVHINESVCGVKSAVSKNLIDKARYERYLSIYENLKNSKKY